MSQPDTPAGPLSDTGAMTHEEIWEIQVYIDRCMRGEPGAPLGWGLVRRLLLSHAWRLRETAAIRAAHDALAAENAVLRAERDAAISRAEAAEKERDKLIDWHIEHRPAGDEPERWRVFIYGYMPMIYHDKAKAVAEVRKAAGLTPAEEEIAHL